MLPKPESFQSGTSVVNDLTNDCLLALQYNDSYQQNREKAYSGVSVLGAEATGAAAEAGASEANGFSSVTFCR